MQKFSFVYFAKACGGWLCAGVNGVVCVVVEGRAVLNDGWDKPRCARQQAIYSQNRNGYEVQLCGRERSGREVWCQQGCGVRWRLDLWRSILQIVTKEKTNRVGTATRQS